MGLFSSSSSKKNYTYETVNEQNQVPSGDVDGNQQLLAVQGISNSDVDLTFTDYGAVEMAGDLAKETIASNERVLSNSIEQVGSAAAKTYELVSEAAQAEATEISKWAIGAFVLVGLAISYVMLKKGKK